MPGTAITVLMVDDDPYVLATLDRLLREAPGIEVVGTTEDAHVAGVLAARTQPDVALVDFGMPGGGELAVRGILAGSPRTRVVALSGSASHVATLAMLRAGAAGYLVKGMDPKEIVAAIVASARGESILDGAVAGGVIGELTAQLERGALQAEEAEALRVQIRDAIEEPRLRSVFQPIIDLVTGSRIGYEALARFAPPPEQGPQAWFADAESVGLRAELEVAAVETAAAAFREVKGPGFLSVNASPDVLPALMPLADILRGRLVVEVTEHAAIDDYQAIAGSLIGLRERSVRLAVDDAGAGFASFRHVLELAPDFVKLDLTLTRGIDRDPRRRALARSLLAFANDLGIAMVAEGIETQAELDALSELGVRFGQGYFLSAPAPPNELHDPS